MCYMIYGAMDKAVNVQDYERIMDNAEYTFSLGTRHDVKMCILNESWEYRVTDRICDCNSALGGKDESAEEIRILADLISKLKTAKDAKNIYISVSWAGKRNKKEATVHIDDIALPNFLANLELECLYTIDLRSREV